MGIEDNNILLKLVIKGQDPAEVEELARQSYGQLKTAAAQHIDALTDYYRQSQQAQTDAAKEAADEKIDAETKALDAVTKLMRQQEIEANRARNAWHGVMEDLENITTVAEGAWEVMSGGFERFKRLGEDITKTTNIYGALTGSIDEMRSATEGEVADIDLIEAKNRGFQESLHLTDTQYGAVAAAAHNFAKVLGVDTKEALDKLVTGLATGRVRTLEMVGVTVNADEANREYAKSIGKTVDQLTDHDKKNALLQESLRAMDRKIVESGGTVHNFASDYEKAMATIQNIHDKLVLGIGRFIESFIEHWQRIPDNIRIIIGKIKDLFPGQTGNADAATADAIAAQAARDMASQKAAQEAVDAAKERLASGGKAYEGATTGFGTDKVSGGKKSGSNAFDDLMAKFAKASPTATEGLNPDEDLFNQASLLPQDEKGLEEYLKASEAAQAADEKRLITMEKVKGLTVDAGVAYQKLATSLGLEVEQLTHEEKMQALNNEAMVKAEELAKKAKAVADARRSELKSTQDKAGFMGVFLWGTDGPDKTYKEMDEFEQRLVDTMGSVSNSLKSESEHMANAVGKSIGASLAGAEAGSTSIKKQTHDALVALAEQAAGKAVWEGAEALASLAVGNLEGAGLHAAAAAAYTGVAVTAGLAARAVGSTSPSSSSKPNSGLVTQQNMRGAGNGLGSTANPAQQAGGPVTINLSVMPGGEAESGRAVMRALQALQNQTGQSVQPLISAH